MLLERIPGVHDVSGRRTVIRRPGPLTGAYVLCAAHRADGSIDVSAAAQVSLWLDVVFGSLGSVELLCHFVDADNLPTVARWTDLASVAGTKVLTRGTSGGPFADWMVNHSIVLHAGTNFVPDVYTVAAFTNETTLTLDRDPTNGSNASAGKGVILAGHQELAIDSSGGISTLAPHTLTLPSSAGDGSFLVTLPTAAAAFLRVLIKGTGTVTGSSAVVGVVPMPAGGV